MALLSDEAIVLRRFAYGETSLVLHLLTRGGGRLPVLAKGAHREKSPFYASLDLLNRLAIVVSHRRGRELQILTEVEVREGHPGLRRDLGRFSAALYASDLVGEAAPEGEPSAPVFDLFDETLGALASGEGDPAAIVLVFELAFLNIIGLGPSFDRCRACATPLPARGTASLSPGSGGAVCASCGPSAGSVGAFPSGTLRAAGRLSNLRPGDARRVRLDARLASGLRRIMDLYLAWHFERPPRSRAHLFFAGAGAAS